jgi:EmrB/QacA subfamily drug resistance transporter
MGRLGDMIGKKSVYITGFIVFTMGSALCGLAPTVYWLIGFRVIQAIGAAMIMGLGMAIITEAFPPSERGKALGIGGAIVSVGIVVGPTLGGVIIDALSWRWIFYVNLPIGIIGTLMALRFVPNFKPSGRQTFDFLGAITLFISLLALLLALTMGQQLGFGDGRILALVGVWLLFLIAFIAIEWRLSQPMIDLRLFRSSLLSINLITGFITFVAIAGSLILMPFYLEDILGYEPHQVGLFMAIVPIGLGVVAPISGSLSDRFGTRRITVIGLILLVLGYLAMSSLSSQTTIAGYILRLIPVGLGMGVFQSPNNSAIMGSAPRERLGVVSGLLSITRTLGQTTGIAILGAFWASRVIAQYGAIPAGGATAAPIDAQVGGLQDTFSAVSVLVALGLGLSVWGLVQERRLRRMAAAEASP